MGKGENNMGRNGYLINALSFSWISAAISFPAMAAENPQTAPPTYIVLKKYTQIVIQEK
jgi:hypothetical protein